MKNSTLGLFALKFCPAPSGPDAAVGALGAEGTAPA